MVNREDLMYKTNKYVYNLQQFEAIRYFAKNIFAGKNIVNDAHKNQSDLLFEVAELKKNAKPKDIERKMQKTDTIESINALYEGK